MLYYSAAAAAAERARALISLYDFIFVAFYHGCMWIDDALGDQRGWFSTSGERIMMIGRGMRCLFLRAAGDGRRFLALIGL